MPLSTTEILATIIIAIAVIKLVVLSISPKAWYSFAGKLYTKPKVTSFIALVLAGIVFYFLQRAGTGIIEVFAVMLFVSLLMVVSLARYVKTIIEFYTKKSKKNLWKEHWLDTLAWIVLLIWGIKELFF
ncbi:hypothetical protein HYT55_05010 [Candidatus Woesearchaeota archaeon]|nr:hypothetical protein [Candidatus Woesearchaeota archaeon]